MLNAECQTAFSIDSQAALFSSLLDTGKRSRLGL
jgi:hypothetical protein